ncbi:MAG: hypothetical protein ACRCW1_02435, partial [Anaerotignaceae bacterium]
QSHLRCVAILPLLVKHFAKPPKVCGYLATASQALCKAKPPKVCGHLATASQAFCKAKPPKL